MEHDFLIDVPILLSLKATYKIEDPRFRKAESGLSYPLFTLLNPAKLVPRSGI
jgi:hypothetical protein